MKIDRKAMETISRAVEHRAALRNLIRSTYSNEALAARFGVNVRTIEKMAALCKGAA